MWTGLQMNVEDANHTAAIRLPISLLRLPRLLPALVESCGFRDLHIRETESQAVATQRETVDGVFGPRRMETTLSLEWSRASDDEGATELRVLVHRDFEPGARFYDDSARDYVSNTLTRLVGRRLPSARETIVGPGEAIEGHIVGTLRDYSGCASPDLLTDLRQGALPLGRWAFSRRPGEVRHDSPLYLARFPNGERMEYSGALICAPTGAGKTELVLRWARAANAAGYCTLIADVKGNMVEKLGQLQGATYRFSTDPEARGPAYSRINFLRDLHIHSPAASDRIRQFAEVLLPSEGWRGAGGDEEMRYELRLVNLVAFIHLLKLREFHYPLSFESGPRNADLGDLYELVFSEDTVCDWIVKIQDAENGRIAAGEQATMPAQRVRHWAQVLGPMLDKAKLPEFGKRVDPRYGYADYVRGLTLALEPFAAHGMLFAKVRDVGEGQLFSLTDLHRRDDQEPATIILEVREQDGDIAWTIFSLVMKSLRPILFRRWNLAKPDKDKLRPILLLLDESRRLRNFPADEYITVAREAHAGCVLVYQNLDQIAEQFGETGLNTILENVGTQIYLRSLSGRTATKFIETLPERYRQIETVNHADGSLQTRMEVVPYFSKLELYQLPAGRYPALVLIRGRHSAQPFLVDMDADVVS